MVIRLIRNNLQFEYWNVIDIQNVGDYIVLDNHDDVIKCNINGEWFANYNTVFINDKTVDKMEVLL